MHHGRRQLLRLRYCVLIVLLINVSIFVYHVLTLGRYRLFGNGVSEGSARLFFERRINISQDQESSPCCRWDENVLVGRLQVNKTPPGSWEELNKIPHGQVLKGGYWKPMECLSRAKVAIVIPFRDRNEHLRILLRQLHPILQRQQLEYRIFVVEQADEDPFNRGKLMNVGFAEAVKHERFNCFVFHDVDLIPEDDRNDYGCPSSPRHMCPEVDKLGYSLFSEALFGGVEAFTQKHFELINGFPNRYWGWGAEDDDLYTRVITKKLVVTRPVLVVGRYKMLDHQDLKYKGNKKGKDLLKEATSQLDQDGLKTLNYTLMDTTDYPLYTLLRVSLDMTEDEEKLTSLARKKASQL